MPKRLFQLLEVVAVHGPQVLESHLGPEHRWHNEACQPGIEPFDEPVYQFTRGHSPGKGLHALYHRLVFGVGDQTLAPVGEEADVLRDGHPVVVEDDD